jgi:hypothetical protein
MKNAIDGTQAAWFSVIAYYYHNRQKICPAIGGDMVDNFLLITLFGAHHLP